MEPGMRESKSHAHGGVRGAGMPPVRLVPAAAGANGAHGMPGASTAAGGAGKGPGGLDITAKTAYSRESATHTPDGGHARPVVTMAEIEAAVDSPVVKTPGYGSGAGAGAGAGVDAPRPPRRPVLLRRQSSARGRGAPPPVAGAHRAGAMQTELVHACLIGKLGRVKYLLREGGRPERVDTSTGWNALHAAAYGGRLMVVDELIAYVQQRYDVDMPEDEEVSQKRTMLDTRTQTATARLTFDGAAKAQSGDTALHIACKRGDVDMVRKLLDNGANPLLENGAKYLPFEVAVKYQQFEAAEAVQHHHKVMHKVGHIAKRKGNRPLTCGQTFGYWNNLLRTKGHACFYMVFLGLLCSLVVLQTQRTKGAFFLTYLMKDKLLQEEFLSEDSHVKKIYRDIGEVTEFWQWLQGPVATTINSPDWKSEREAAGPGSGFIHGHNRLVGPVQLRQMRVKPGSCGLIRDFGSANLPCYAEDFSTESQDTAPFGPGGKFKYHSAEELGGESVLGILGVANEVMYPNGGYVEYLHPVPLNTTVHAGPADIVAQLMDEGWIDLATRVVFVNMNVYNPNVDLWVVATFMAEFPATGGTVVSFSMDTMRLRVMDGLDGTQIQLVTGFMFAFLAVYVMMGMNIYRHTVEVELQVMDHVAAAKRQAVRWHCEHHAGSVSPARSATQQGARAEPEAVGGSSMAQSRPKLDHQRSTDTNTAAMSTRISLITPTWSGSDAGVVGAMPSGMMSGGARPEAGSRYHHVGRSPSRLLCGMLCCRYRMSAFFSNVFSVINIVVLIIAVGLQAQADANAKELDLTVESTTYVNLIPVSKLTVLSRYLMVFVMIVSWLKVIELLVPAPFSIGLLARVIGKIPRDLAPFFLMLIVYSVGFAFAFNITFGHELEEYRDFWRSIMTLFRSMFGDSGYEQLVSVNRVLAPLLTFLHLLTAGIVFINILIAMLNFRYEELRENAIEEYGRFVFRDYTNAKLRSQEAEEVLRPSIDEDASVEQQVRDLVAATQDIQSQLAALATPGKT